MPVINLPYNELELLTKADKESILERIAMIGADVDKIEADYAAVEFFPDRPDMFSVEGVARAMRGFMNIETGLAEYNVSDSDVSITVEPSVLPIRPWLVCAIVRGVDLSYDEAIESIMGLQEDLHWGLGRNRRKVSVGVHDISKVKPPFRYLAVDPSFEFTPLDYDYDMSMREILEKHPKGVKFSFILDGMGKYPIILDSEDNVLSFPPIINCEITRVTEYTRDFLIEVTGLDRNVETALNIVVTALAERGGRMESVLIKQGDGERRTPDLTPSAREIRVSETCKLIGVDLTADDCIRHLERMRFGAEKIDEDRINVLVPAYRADILHPWDIMEDIAISYGYDNIEPELPSTLTIGRTHPVEDVKNLAREITMGLGYMEVMTFTLTNEHKHFQMMRRMETPVVKVSRPISEEQTMLRSSLLPSLMEILSLNTHRELPQRIFEAGDVVIDALNAYHLAGVSIHAEANFAEIVSVVRAVLRELALEAEFSDSDDPAFLPGRCADILVNGNVIGVFGEIHPDVITNFGLEHPVVGFEIDLGPVISR